MIPPLPPSSKGRCRSARQANWTKWTARHFLFLATAPVLLASCREAPIENVASETGSAQLSVYAGQGRDRLCLSNEAGGRAGFITYAAGGDANCSVRGSWREGPAPAIVPDGDEQCAISFDGEGDVVTLGAVSARCAYYCGPGASFGGKTFVRMEKPGEVADVAGDPLC